MSTLGWLSRATALGVLSFLAAGDLDAQAAGRWAKVVLSDSVSVFVYFNGKESNVTTNTPEGIFRTAADSSALASWAAAARALPGPTPKSRAKSGAPMMLSGSVLRATDESGNVMRLVRLSGDSASPYQLGVANGAWEFRERVTGERVLLLLTALAGGDVPGLNWAAIEASADSTELGVLPAEAAPGNPRPRYPRCADVGCASGVVLTQFTVGPDGRVRRATLQILRSTHPLFSLAVRDVLPALRFVPASRSGSPIEQTVKQAFEFRGY